MGEAIGIRLPNDVLKNIDKLSSEEMIDRSTILRKLLIDGYKEYMKKKSAEKYISGKITLSDAADKAGITLWEMEEYLVMKGFKSEYSIEDLKREIRLMG